MVRSAAWLTKATVATLCLVMAACTMAGCKNTEVLTRTIYDQTATEVDYNNPEKFYINDSTSEETSDQVAANETSDDAENATAVQNLVVYGSEPNTQGYVAKKSAFAKNPSFTGIEASEAVSLFYSTDKDAIDYEIPEPDEDQQEQPEDSNSVVASGASGKSSTSEGENGSGSKGKGSNPDKTSSEGGSTDDADEGEGAGAEGIVDIADTTEELSDPPLADSIAAFGEAAVIVQMLGGEGALAAADSELLEGRFSAVFKDEGAANIATGWEGDGTDAGQMDVNAVIESGATTVLVYASSYENGLTVKQAKRLHDAGVSFTIIYPLTNSTYIKKDVSTIAKILAKSEGIGNAGKVQDVADDYLEFHDALVEAGMRANGGKLAGTAVYEAKNTAYNSANCNSDAPYTLLVDGYDTTATYTGKFHSFKPDSTGGVALASVGTISSPVSFYIQAGGMINNACAQTSTKDTGKMVVWQFSYNHLSFAKAKWKYESDGELASAFDVKQTAEGWGKTLLTTTVGQSGAYGRSFGTDTFPKLIVTSAAYEKALIANSKRENGIYHPYDHQEVEGVRMSGFGTVVDDSLLFACIGANDSEENLFAGKSGNSIPDSAIEVNPVGLFSSWTEGSVESVLETAWVNDVVNENDTQVSVSGQEGWRAITTYFYQTFYRYDLTSADLSTMEQGI